MYKCYFKLSLNHQGSYDDSRCLEEIAELLDSLQDLARKLRDTLCHTMALEAGQWWLLRTGIDCPAASAQGPDLEGS